MTYISIAIVYLISAVSSSSSDALLGIEGISKTIHSRSELYAILNGYDQTTGITLLALTGDLSYLNKGDIKQYKAMQDAVQLSAYKSSFVIYTGSLTDSDMRVLGVRKSQLPVVVALTGSGVVRYDGGRQSASQVMRWIVRRVNIDKKMRRNNGDHGVDEGDL